jgi:hypothetical protein
MTKPNRDEFRRDVLLSSGATAQAAGELLRYGQNEVDDDALATEIYLPLQDESFVAPWEQYAKEMVNAGTVQVLARYLVQLQFPIRSKISCETEYISATRCGADPSRMKSATGSFLRRPEDCSIELHSTPTGRIPVVTIPDRQDFVSITRALTCKNEPIAIPASQGACFVSGYKNWPRFRSLVSKNREGRICAEADVLAITRKQKHLYQDKFVLLTSGPYSGVSANELGLEDEEWDLFSWRIRLEHECTHYIIQRLLGVTKGGVLAEIIADYCGITAVRGSFSSEWFLRFMGLECYPEFRDSGRLANYRGTPPVSSESFRVLQTLVVQAARNLQSVDSTYQHAIQTSRAQLAFIAGISALTLEEVASDACADLIARKSHYYERVFLPVDIRLNSKLSAASSGGN